MTQPRFPKASSSSPSNGKIEQFGEVLKTVFLMFKKFFFSVKNKGFEVQKTKNRLFFFLMLKDFFNEERRI